MREKFEKRFFRTENTKKPGEETEKQEPGLAPLKEEIKGLIKEYSAETFGKAKKKKTEERQIGEKDKEGIMKEYPSREKDFRKDSWFQKLTREEKEKTEFEIMKNIHETAKGELNGLHNKFFEKLSFSTQEYFKENRKRREKNEKPLFPPKELKEEVINAIEKYKNQFGFLPANSYDLGPNCVGFTNFVGRVFEHYGFKSGTVSVPRHIASLVELKRNERYVSDMEFSEPLLFKKWIERVGEMMESKIKLSDIALGYFGGHESGVHFNLGIFLDGLKRYNEAEKEYRKAIEIDPNNTNAHNNLGSLLIDLKRFPEAEKELREALKIKPNYAIAHHNLGLLYRDMWENDKARDEILTAKELYEEKGRKEGVEKCKILLKEIPANLPKNL